MIRSRRHNIDGANHVRKRSSSKGICCAIVSEEREQLGALIRKRKSSAQRLMKARILLKADVSEDGEGWSDSQIVEALETSATTVTLALDVADAGEQGCGTRHCRAR